MTQAKLKAWVQASRAPFFVATVIPLSLGGAVAWKEGAWSSDRWIVVFIASFLVHLCTNLANDYFDFSSGADSGESIGGSRVLQEGKITLSEIRNVLIICYVVAALLGIWIVWTSKVWGLIPLMLFAFFSSVFYTAPPIRYGYLGLGETFVALNMGPVMVAGTTAAVAGRFSLDSLWLSIPIGLMVALILYYQSLPDMEVDRSVDKMTLSVRLGKANAIWGFRCFIAATMASFVALVASGIIHPVALTSLGTIFLAFKIDKMIRETPDWVDLHGRGGKVRLFYFVNGLILVFGVMMR
jgi:1,4-dihydroxy-2-naphthoate polyprenyltransferase